jgi:hypothetical protein
MAVDSKITKSNENVPPLLRNEFIKDVTSQYVSTKNIRIKILKSAGDGLSVAHLCVFNNESWIPIANGKISDGYALFKNIGRNAVYLPVYYKKGEGVPAGNPFILYKDGRLVPIKIDRHKTQSVFLSRKYPLNGIKIWWLTLMGQGLFQGANRADFEDAITLYRIPDTISMKMNLSVISKPASYRYVRYLFPENKSGSLGEVAFYKDKKGNEPLTGKWIWADGVDSSDVRIAFDGHLDKFIDRTPNRGFKFEVQFCISGQIELEIKIPTFFGVLCLIDFQSNVHQFFLRC